MRRTIASFFRLQSRELFAGNDPQLGPHSVVSRSAKFVARHLIFTRMRELKLRLADRSWQDLDGVPAAIDRKRMDHVGASDAKMDRDPCGNQNAMRDEKVLLSNHAHGDRAIGILLGSEVILGELSPQVKRQRIDVARALQKTNQGNVDLIGAGGRDQAQSQHGQQERSYLSPVHSRFALTPLKVYPRSSA